MAVSVMGSEMGLKVCAIEKHKIGGECMNVGCIPSKALLRMAKTRHLFEKLADMELAATSAPDVLKPFQKIASHLNYINENKNRAMFEKVDLVLSEGEARFLDAHTVQVGERRISAKRIYIATGTRPWVPDIEGIESVEFLTNENLFALEKIPDSMVILGGGAIGCEMAQAFHRLGCACKVVHLGDHLLPAADPQAGELLAKAFDEEGIEVYHSATVCSVAQKEGALTLTLKDGRVLEAQTLLVAAGRQPDFSRLSLENAGVELTSRGYIKVDKRLRTTAKNIYAVGDCNGFGFANYVVPWTVFTDPAISMVGETEANLKEKGIRYEAVTMQYGDYGAAIAEGVGVGFVKVLTSKAGRVYGVTIVGEGSGEMINEWALVIQKKIRLYDVMFLQHSFPTMGFLSKRASEQWMMNRMKWAPLKRLCRMMF
jgi:pyruvate/2-oxoglutarate dehydrogenase complex dihydrolipoamide dehydrogenase (E3) component